MPWLLITSLCRISSSSLYDDPSFFRPAAIPAGPSCTPKGQARCRRPIYLSVCCDEIGPEIRAGSFFPKGKRPLSGLAERTPRIRETRYPTS